MPFVGMPDTSVAQSLLDELASIDWQRLNATYLSARERQALTELTRYKLEAVQKHFQDLSKDLPIYADRRRVLHSIREEKLFAPYRLVEGLLENLAGYLAQVEAVNGNAPSLLRPPIFGTRLIYEFRQAGALGVCQLLKSMPRTHLSRRDELRAFPSGTFEMSLRNPDEEGYRRIQTQNEMLFEKCRQVVLTHYANQAQFLVAEVKRLRKSLEQKRLPFGRDELEQQIESFKTDYALLKDLYEEAKGADWTIDVMYLGF
jgi:hypothetical protein